MDPQGNTTLQSPSRPEGAINLQPLPWPEGGPWVSSFKSGPPEDDRAVCIASAYNGCRILSEELFVLAVRGLARLAAVSWRSRGGVRVVTFYTSLWGPCRASKLSGLLAPPWGIHGGRSAN